MFRRSHASRGWWCLPLSIGLAIAASSRAEVVFLGSVKDGTIYEPGVVNGVVANGSGQHMFSGRNPGQERRRAIVQFDVAGSIPAGVTITNVQMILNMSRTTASVQTINLRRVLASWGEGACNADLIGGGGRGAPILAGETNWQYRFYPTILWGAEGGDLAPTVSGSTDVDFLAFYTWNSTPAMVADVQSWLANPAANFGWALVGNEDQFPTVKRFDTREHVTPANRPKLIVTYLPPGSCTCLADVNGDSDRDGRDIQTFVHCLLGSGTNCSCADMNGGGLDASDVAAFVSQILSGTDCP